MSGSTGRAAGARTTTVVGLLHTTAALACGASLLSALAEYAWVFDLATHFRPQYMLVLVLAAVAAAIQRWWPSAAVFVAFAVANAASMAPLYTAPAPVSEDAPPMRLMLLNVFSYRCGPDAFADVAARHEPDLMLLLEVDHEWRRALDGLAGYPHRLEELRDDAFGIALLSKRPLSESQVIFLGERSLPGVRARVPLGDRSLAVVGLHAPPPVSPWHAHRRDEYLREAGVASGTTQAPAVLLGDLNATPWSVAFKRLVAASGFRNSALGWGVQGTWPSWSPSRIPIDHALVSSDVVVRHRVVGPRTCSDHLPLVVDVALAR